MNYNSGFFVECCMRARLCLVVLITSLVTLPLGAAPDQSDKKAQLKQLFADQWEYELRESPELATSIGDYRYNDRWSDSSLAHVQQQKQDLQKWLAKFQSIDSTGLDEQETVSLHLMVRNLKERIEGIELKTYLMPVDQFNGVQLELAQFPALVPTDSTKHYEDYISRLHKIPVVIDQAIEVLQQGKKEKLMPPRFLLEKTVEQCRKIADATADSNAFAQPVKEFPASIPESDQKRLRQAVLAAIDRDVRPAYLKLKNYLAKQYAPYGRTDPGVWALPNGDALYRYDIRLLTTTNMEPEQIHQLGLSEVSRIEGEQLVIANKLGFEDLKAFRASLKANPRTYAKSPDEILANKLRSFFTLLGIIVSIACWIGMAQLQYAKFPVDPGMSQYLVDQISRQRSKIDIRTCCEVERAHLHVRRREAHPRAVTLELRHQTIGRDDLGGRGRNGDRFAPRYRRGRCRRRPGPHPQRGGQGFRRARRRL